MTLRPFKDMNKTVEELVKAAGSDGLLVGLADEPQYVVFPLDDDFLDYLIERNPRFIEECGRIRERMNAGEHKTHDEVKSMLGCE